MDLGLLAMHIKTEGTPIELRGSYVDEVDQSIPQRTLFHRSAKLKKLFVSAREIARSNSDVDSWCLLSRGSIRNTFFFCLLLIRRITHHEIDILTKLCVALRLCFSHRAVSFV